MTSTIIQLVPEQQALGLRVAVLGSGLPANLPHVRFRDLWKLWRRPDHGGFRVWHARRNVEMLPGLLLRDVLRMPVRIVFTSASQRHHTRWSRFLISRMDAVIATSRKTAAYLKRPATVILHGIDTDRFRPAENHGAAKRAVGLDADRRYVGCFGRVRRQKGTDLFVDALIKLLPDHPDWVGLVAGRTTPEHRGFERYLRDRIEQAGLSGRILFVGEHAAIENWHRALDLFVAPQRWEGFGLTPLEAMASGVPVAASDVGAFSELIVDGETGYVVAPDDLDALVEGIRVYLADGARRLQAGRAARERVRRDFPLAREAAAVNAVYQQLMDAS